MADLPVPVGPTNSIGTSSLISVSRKNLWRTVSTVGMMISLTYTCTQTYHPNTYTQTYHPNTCTQTYHPDTCTQTYHPDTYTQTYHPNTCTQTYHPNTCTQTYHPNTYTQTYHPNTYTQTYHPDTCTQLGWWSRWPIHVQTHKHVQWNLLLLTAGHHWEPRNPRVRAYMYLWCSWYGGGPVYPVLPAAPYPAHFLEIEVEHCPSLRKQVGLQYHNNYV